MSDVTMDTPDASHVFGSTTRGMKPDLFYGDRRKLEVWLLQMDRHFHVEGDKIEDDDKVVLASTYMKGDAEKWVEPILRKYMDETIIDDDNTALVEDWTTFKTRLRQIFAPIKESVIAEQKIQNLRQTTSVAEYTTIFQQYMEQIDWDDRALTRMYKQGLKMVVREELMRTGATTATLKDLMDEAIRLDNNLYELQIESRSYRTPNPNLGKRQNRRNNGNQGNFRRYQPNQGRQRNNHNPRGQGYYAPGGLEAMHLDNLMPGKPLLTKQREPTPKKEITCYACQKKGHMARDCRSKNKVTRQLNMITQGDQEEAAEEWTVVTPEETTETPEREEVLIDDDLSGKSLEELSNLRDRLAQRTRANLAESEEALDQLTKEFGQNISLVWRNRIQRQKEKINAAQRAHALIQRVATPYYEDKTDSENEEPDPPTLEQTRRAQYIKPHPGSRIHGPWDQESNKENCDPEERAMTPEELAIDAPPASPKLVRQNATLMEPRSCQTKQKDHILLNDQQALYIYDQPNWVDNADEAYRQRNYEHATTSQSTKYLVDTRNPKHNYLHWTACPQDSCHVHYSGKQDGYFPCRDLRKDCQETATDCPKDACAKHLYDKRVVMNYFPTHSKTDNVQHRLTIDNRCLNREWQTCLADICEIHYPVKLANGYAKENPFLDRTPAALSAATRSTLKDSSNSR